MLLDDISIHIETNIDSLTDGDNLYKNYYPDDPDIIISVIDLGGFPPNKYSITREKKYEIKLRSQNYSYGIDLGNKIFKLFHSKENYTLGDFFIASSYASTELSYLYADDKNRKEFSLELVFQYKY